VSGLDAEKPVIALARSLAPVQPRKLAASRDIQPYDDLGKFNALKLVINKIVFVL
jgi:hypothetical protein